MSGEMKNRKCNIREMNLRERRQKEWETERRKTTVNGDERRQLTPDW
jgi:hypothetical protein